MSEELLNSLYKRIEELEIENSLLKYENEQFK